MKLSKIFSKLKFENSTWWSNYNSDIQIYFVKELKKYNATDPNTLYICLENELSKNIDITGINILCIVADINLTDTKHFHNSNLIAVYTNDSIENVVCSLEKILADYISLVENKDKIIRLLDIKNNPQDIIEESYKILGNPIFVVDNSYKIIAKSPDVENIRLDIKEQTEKGYISEDNIKDLRTSKLYDIARNKKYPVYDINKKDGHGWITSMITSHGIEIAHLAGADINNPFSDNDLEFIDFICKIIANQLSNEDAKFLSNENLDSMLLTDLLQYSIRDENTVERRCRSLSWPLDEYLFILAIHSGNNDLSKKKNLISNALRSIFSNAKWTVLDGRLVFLVNSRQPYYDVFISNQNFLDFLNINGLQVSISRAFTRYIDTMRFFSEAMAAYHIGERVNPIHNIHIYNNYLFHHIAGILSENHNLSNFIHPAIPKILEYDKIHKSNLLETLRLYLLYPDNPTLISNMLYVHKNTLFNRVNKLKDEFALDFSSGDELLSLAISLKFMEMDK